jgi:ATP-binding cassette subfamily B protein
MLRSGIRLVVLDEPARGLGHERRYEMLARSRRQWQDATLLAITHDVDATRDLPQSGHRTSPPAACPR